MAKTPQTSKIFRIASFIMQNLEDLLQLWSPTKTRRSHKITPHFTLSMSIFLFLCVSVSQKTWALHWTSVTLWENIWVGNWVIYWRRPWISWSNSDTPTAASFSTEISFFSRCRCGCLSWFYNCSQLEGKSKKTACLGEDWYWTLLILQPSEVIVKFHSAMCLFPTFIQSWLCT